MLRVLRWAGPTVMVAALVGCGGHSGDRGDAAQFCSRRAEIAPIPREGGENVSAAAEVAPSDELADALDDIAHLDAVDFAASEGNPGAAQDARNILRSDEFARGVEALHRYAVEDCVLDEAPFFESLGSSPSPLGTLGE